MTTKIRLLHDTVGIPTGAVAVTQSASDNTTKVATTAYVTTALANLADSAPSTLNTLNELAAALGDDANFSTTVTNSIALKAPLASPALTGTVTAASHVQIAGNLDVVGQIAAYNNPGSAWGAMGFRATDYTFKNSGGTVKVSIDSSGAVGIGQVPETARFSGHDILQVGGRATFLGNDTVSSTGQTALLDNLYYDASGNFQHRGDARGVAMQFVEGKVIFSNSNQTTGTPTVTPRMTLDNSGNVGIGTTAPDSPLEISGSDDIRLKITDTLASSELMFRSSGADTQIYTNTAHDLGIYTSGNVGQLHLKQSNGNVGIGTTGPTQKLDVNSGTSNVVASFTSTDGIGAIQLADNAGNVELSAVGNDFHIQNAGSAAKMVVLNSGKVGIGTASPVALLHINGTGDAIRVTSTNTGQGGAQMDLLHYTSSPADGDIPGVINFGGYYSGTASAYSAAIKSVWSNAGGREGQLQFITRQSGSQFDTQLTINHLGHAHLGHDKGSVQFYVGNQGGIMGGNASHNVRGAGNLFMFNAGGTNGVYQFEANGAARLNIANDGVSLASAAPSADSYTHKFRTSNSADPGLLLYREDQCGFGIAVRNATVDYATFSLSASAGQNTAYDAESGPTNMIMRLYQNKDVIFPANYAHNVTDGVQIIGSTGRMFQTFNYNSAGAEVFLQNNRTSGTVAAFQYRINNSAQSGGTIYAATNGYTGGNFSDYRLKNNVADLTGSLDKINALRVVSYNHVDSPDLTELGVIAHEIKEVFPEFVRGEKDAVWSQSDIDNYEGELPDVVAGDIKAQQVDYFSKEWTSHFIKAIQELKAENDALKARIETLEG